MIVVGLAKLAGSPAATFRNSNCEDVMARSSLISLTQCIAFFSIFSVFLILAIQPCSGTYYGKLIGNLSELHHDVSGVVYASDGRTLYIKGFTYDGEGPAAYFYIGNSKTPRSNGFRIRDEYGTNNVLKRYQGKDISLTLPEGKTLNNIKWFSVWCDEFSVNFGDVKIPQGFEYPRPLKLAPLSGIHGVSSEAVVVVDTQTLLIPKFSYDGEAPDAKFWVGVGSNPSPQGIRIPDENGKLLPLRAYDHKTIVLTLPNNLTVHHLGHFGVWCEAFAVDFGHVLIPSGINVPPSLKTLGISPQSKLNCEVLQDNLAFEVRWAIAGDSIVLQLVAKLDAGEYMSFGLSPNEHRSIMVGGDVVVAWVNQQTLQGYAVDYFLDAKSQCSGGRGSCPDKRIQDGTDSVRLLSAVMVNGYSIVTYQRPLKASDELDLLVKTNGSQAILWAIGPLNQRNEVSFHSKYLQTDKLINFGRPPNWNCPTPDQNQGHVGSYSQKEINHQGVVIAATMKPQYASATPAPASKKDAWVIPPIQCNEPEDGVFYAQMGPTGGKHGYPAITGHVGWGISWYINGLLIPEINVVRGKKYTFVVEGGLDPETPARYHPFYITDDPIGGYQHKTSEEKTAVKIFAGVRYQRGTVKPTGIGRLCNWSPDPNQPADEFSSFGAYQRTLTLKCDPGEPGIVEWIPDEDTPHTVYYQCFTHRYLGWKINVHDNCDTTGAASETHQISTLPLMKSSKLYNENLEESSSIHVPSKVTPAFWKHSKYSFHNIVHDNTNINFDKLDPHSQLTQEPSDDSHSFEVMSSSSIALKKHPFIKHGRNHHNPVHLNWSQIVNEGYRSSSVLRGYRMVERRDKKRWKAFISNKHSSQFVADSLGSLMSHGVKFPNRQTSPSTFFQAQQQREIYPEKHKNIAEKPFENYYRIISAPPLSLLAFSLAVIEPMRFMQDRNNRLYSGSSSDSSNVEKMNSLEKVMKIIKFYNVKKKRSPLRLSIPFVVENDSFPENSEKQSINSFELISVTSLPDYDRGIKLMEKNILTTSQSDELNDMQMAADGLNVYYLPPLTFQKKSENKKNIDYPSDILIAYDGKKVLDSDLARSIFKVNNRVTSTLSSELLSMTPQFGQFRGDLPPPIPEDVRLEDVPQLSARYSQKSIV